jgi:hypothetical protein
MDLDARKTRAIFPPFDQEGVAGAHKCDLGNL